MLSKKQEIQEQEYAFPYHHLLKRKELRGIEYFSYLDTVIKLIQKQKNPFVLDLGCGDGKGTKEFKKFFKKVSGIDYSKMAISFARAFSPNIDFKVFDFTQKTNKLPPQYQIVVCMEVIEHIPPEKLENFAENIAKVLQPEGKIIITTLTTNLKVAKKHYQHFNEKKLDHLLEKYFQKEGVTYQSNKYSYFLFFLLRGILTNRYYDFNLPLINHFLSKLHKLLVEKATSKTGRRIVYIGKKK